MRKGKVVSFVLAACMVLSMPYGVAKASNTARDGQQETELDYSDYGEAVWSDEFNGTSLNRDDWNVELHDPGWVNSELQAYVDSEENIQVKDGNLYIYPQKKVEVSAGGNILNNSDFSAGLTGWSETIANWGGDFVADASSTTSDGKIVYDIVNPGTDVWHVQLKQEGLKLANGVTYTVSYNIQSTEARQVLTGVQKCADDGYTPFKKETLVLEANTVKAVNYDFTMSEEYDKGVFYISMGKILTDGVETPASTITISDVKITAGEGAPAAETVSYTSGRISTQNKQTFTYGLYEVRAKVPAGQGYLPAFWLMANDENVYGQWPRCGEIDCMEVMGQEPEKLYGTIHYGNPHSESQGTYVLDDSSFADDFHTFSCEWEPGKIRWYVDGKLYHEESDWHSTTEGQGTLTYPAPFDQPFYIILNLAVGGSWVGNPDETTSFDNNPYVIDYVRVYQKDSYDENVMRPEKEVILRDPDENGNYINNGNYSVVEDLTDDTDWKFMTALGGEATAEIADNTLTVNTTNEGTVDYSVQLVQAKLPFEKGATYKVSFDAYASENRTIKVDIKAPDYGYKSYMPSKTANLTTTTQHFEYEFVMKDSSDANGRLEYNMGAADSTATVYLSNVKVEKTADPDPNAKEEKVVLANGNYIYNGKFQEGEKHLGYWTVSPVEAASVTGFTDGRRCVVTVPETEGASVVLSQEDLTFAEGNTYTFSINAQSATDSSIEVVIGGNKYVIDVAGGDGRNTYSVKIPDTTKFTDKNISIRLATPGTISLDDVSLVESALIKNGSFKDGFTGFEWYADSSASASYVVDSLQEDNALDVTVNKTGDADWKVQVKQNNVPLEKGKKYRLTFKAKSSLDRDIRVVMQGLEPKGWPVYSSDNIVSLTNEYQVFTDEFVMEKDSDPNAFLSICLGNVTEEINTQHRVCIDDISLVEVVEDDNPGDDNPGGDKPGDDNPGGDTPGEDKPIEDNPEKINVTLSGVGHVQSAGNVNGSYNTDENVLTLGTTGQAKRLEQIKIDFVNNTKYSGTMQYRVHRQTYGWTDWVDAGKTAGTTGEGKRLEAVQIRLTGELAEHYSVAYRAHVQTYGWSQGWQYDGALAGTEGEAKRMECLQVKLVEKASEKQGVSYRVHRQTYGWEPAYSTNGKVSGTTGQSKRLEGIEISLTGNEYSGGISYETHVQSYGWMKSVSDGMLSGTTGQAKRLEAIKISLTGEVAKHYDVYYRVHAQSYGWMSWTKNGAPAGTEGLGKRLEAIQIVLVEKGGSAPSDKYEGVTSANSKSFIKK